MKKHSQKGVSGIEFAIVLPGAVLIFYAIVSYSVSFLYLMTLNNMAAEAARSGVSVFTTSGPVRENLINDRIQSVMENSLIQADSIIGCLNGEIWQERSNVLEICMSAPLPIPRLAIVPLPEFLEARASVQLRP